MEGVEFKIPQQALTSRGDENKLISWKQSITKFRKFNKFHLKEYTTVVNCKMGRSFINSIIPVPLR